VLLVTTKKKQSITLPSGYSPSPNENTRTCLLVFSFCENTHLDSIDGELGGSSHHADQCLEELRLRQVGIGKLRGQDAGDDFRQRIARHDMLLHLCSQYWHVLCRDIVSVGRRRGKPSLFGDMRAPTRMFRGKLGALNRTA